MYFFQFSIILKQDFTFFIFPGFPFKLILQNSFIIYHTKTRVMTSVLPCNKQIDYI